MCSFHVVEHIPNILEHLKKANAIVKQGGYLFLATPSADAIQHKLPFRLSPHYDAAHFYVFSELALRKALDASGWELIEIRSNEYLVYWARLATKLFRKIFKKSETQTAGEYIQNAGLFSLCIYKFFSVFLSPFLKLQSSLHLGNELFVVAKKDSKLLL